MNMKSKRRILTVAALAIMSFAPRLAAQQTSRVIAFNNLPTECALGRVLGVPCDGLISVPTNLSHTRCGYRLTIVTLWCTITSGLLSAASARPRRCLGAPFEPLG